MGRHTEDPESPKVVPFDPKKRQDTDSADHNESPAGKERDHGKGGKK